MAQGVFRPLLLALTCLLALTLAGPSHADRVTIFAAASLKTALDDIAAVYRATTGTELSLSYAGSSALARQIEQGAPADLFISANPGWMDRLADLDLLIPDSRRDLLRNRLVLIGHGPAPSPLPDGPLPDDPLTALPALLGQDRLAMALVDAVPAGIYGKAALQSLGQWTALAPQVAQTDNVRAALALVARGEAPLGIVYATDALAEHDVHVLATFPADSHPPILYPAALIRGATRPAAQDVLTYLASPAAQAVFARHGFLPVAE